MATCFGVSNHLQASIHYMKVYSMCAYIDPIMYAHIERTFMYLILA